MVDIMTAIFESFLQDFRDNLNIDISKEAVFIEHIQTNHWCLNRGFFVNCRIDLMSRLQTIKAIVNSHSFKSPKSEEPRRVQVLDLYCLTRFESILLGLRAKVQVKGLSIKD